MGQPRRGARRWWQAGPVGLVVEAVGTPARSACPACAPRASRHGRRRPAASCPCDGLTRAHPSAHPPAHSPRSSHLLIVANPLWWRARTVYCIQTTVKEHMHAQPQLDFRRFSAARQHIAKALAVGALSLVAAGAAQADVALPGKGTTVRAHSKLDCGKKRLQTILVSKALEKLGYTVKAPQETEYATGHLALANGDATFMATHWDPLHADFYRNAGGRRQAVAAGHLCAQFLAGLPDRQEDADQYKITHISQLSDPALAKLFDTNGDGKADLTGCNPGWAVSWSSSTNSRPISCAAPSRTTRAAMPH